MIRRNAQYKPLLFTTTVRNPESNSFFIAPRIHADTWRWRDFIKFTNNLAIIPFSIEEFITALEQGFPSFHSVSPTNNSRNSPPLVSA